jgi:hypothetical protein
MELMKLLEKNKLILRKTTHMIQNLTTVQRTKDKKPTLVDSQLKNE